MTKSLYFVLIIISCFSELVSCQWSYIGENNLYFYEVEETIGDLDEYPGINCIINDNLQFFELTEDPVTEALAAMPEYVWVDPDAIEEDEEDTEEEEEEEEEADDDGIIYGDDELVAFVESCDWDEDNQYSCTNCTTNATTGEEVCDEYVQDGVIYYQKKLYNLYRNTTTCHYMMDRNSKIEWTTIFLDMRY